MSIEKSISPKLTNLLAEINFTLEEQESTLKEKLSKFCNQATKEGFSKEEIRDLLKKGIPKISEGYLRRNLPEELKFTEKRNKPKLSEDDSKIINIPTAYEIKEAQSTEKEDYQENQDFKNFRESNKIDESYSYDSDKLQQEKADLEGTYEHYPTYQELQLKVQELEQLVTELENKLSETLKGEYNIPLKEKYIPVRWTLPLKTQKIEIEIDSQRAKRMGI